MGPKGDIIIRAQHRFSIVFHLLNRNRPRDLSGPSCRGFPFLGERLEFWVCEAVVVATPSVAAATDWPWVLFAGESPRPCSVGYRRGENSFPIRSWRTHGSCSGRAGAFFALAAAGELPAAAKSG